MRLLVQGLLSVTFALILLSLRLMLTVFVTQRNQSQRTPATASDPEHRPRLVRLQLKSYRIPVRQAIYKQGACQCAL